MVTVTKQLPKVTLALEAATEAAFYITKRHTFTRAFSCFGEGKTIGVSQVGNVVAVANYRSDDKVDCGHNFTLVVP
jgi:hypothetical protein